ncbi:MAG: glycosyltransferase family 4 protein [bacterium]
MNILVLTDFLFPDSMGGANKMAFCTSRGLAGRGHHVFLIVRRARPGLADRETIDGIEVYRYDLPKKTFAGFYLSARPQIRNILRSIEGSSNVPLEIVILHQPLAAAEAMTHAFVRDAPWLYNFHSPWGEEFLINRPVHWFSGWNPALIIRKRMRDWIEGRVLRRCQGIMLLSEFMRGRLERVHGLAARSVIIPGGVDTGVFSPPKDQVGLCRDLGLPVNKVILFTVRNLRKRMGLANLVRAMAELGRVGDRVHLVLAGRGELEGSLKGMAEELGVADRITFTGQVPEQELPRFYQAADFFVLPTEYLEGFGMVTLESLAAGTPVIATPVGATPEILSLIGDEWLCRDASIGALAERIEEMVIWRLENPDEYSKTRKRCRDCAVTRYAWPIIIDQWEARCKEVIRTWRMGASIPLSPVSTSSPGWTGEALRKTPSSP